MEEKWKEREKGGNEINNNNNKNINNKANVDVYEKIPDTFFLLSNFANSQRPKPIIVMLP